MQKVALITGCSTGIGRELALQLNRRGWKVVATARRIEALKPLAEAGCLVFPLDVTDFHQIKKTTTKITDTCGRIDILINNAGYALISPLLDIPSGMLEQQFQTNLFGMAEMIREVAPVMKLQGSGTIVNIGSISGISPTPFAGAYCASKAAVHAWSDSLRMELKPFGIRVITIQPGGIETDFGRNSEKMVNQIFKEESWYGKVKKYVHQRAVTSQEHATPVAVFVQNLIPRLEQPHPPAIIRMGSKSFYLPLMKRWLPVRWLDAIMMKKFGLTELRTPLGT